MASEVTPSRFGRQNATGTDYTNLFLKKFAGEVLTTFETENVFKPLHTVRTIESGKSAQFPVTGIATAKYHVPGDNMLLAANSYVNDIKHAEVVINIDSLLTSSTFVSRIDEAMNHYDVRSIYTTELGRALSKKFDKTLAKVAVLAARQSTTISGGFGGQSVTTGATPTGATLAAKIFEAAQKLDQQDIPAEDRVCVLAPAEYYTLLQSIAATSNANPVGSYIDGNVAKVAGITIVKSNNLPNGTTATADTGVNASSAASNLSGYAGTFTNTLGVVFHKAAIGTVKLLDLAVESEYKIELQGTFMVAKYAMGHGVLRPEAAVEIKTA